MNSNGVVMRLVPSKGQDRYQDKDAQWPNITPAGRKAKDIGLGTGSMMSAFVTTDEGIYGWNGRLPTSSGTAMPDWEAVGGVAERVATGPDGRPWVVNASADVFRLGPRENALCVFTTSDAGKVRGTARAADGSLFQDEHVWINGSTDLRRRHQRQQRRLRLRYLAHPLGDPRRVLHAAHRRSGPAGGLGSMYIYIEDEGGFKDYKQFFLRTHHTLTIDYNGTKAGIKRISWSDGNDPG